MKLVEETHRSSLEHFPRTAKALATGDSRYRFADFHRAQNTEELLEASMSRALAGVLVNFAQGWLSMKIKLAAPTHASLIRAKRPLLTAGGPVLCLLVINALWF